SGALNVGTGVETDVNRLHAIMARAAGVEAKPSYAPGRPGEQKRSCIDPAAATAALGWRAEVPLEEGLRRTVEFFRGLAGR
ncbi:MAG TPA: UDP-glucose 4-epimerase, partial [Anaeromyxobacteraceae bacterium]